MLFKFSKLFIYIYIYISSLLPELNIKIPSQSLNQNTLKDTSTLIKRSYVDVLVNGNEVVNDGANETKAVEETKIDERNIKKW